MLSTYITLFHLLYYIRLLCLLTDILYTVYINFYYCILTKRYTLPASIAYRAAPYRMHLKRRRAQLTIETASEKGTDRETDTGWTNRSIALCSLP